MTSNNMRTDSGTYYSRPLTVTPDESPGTFQEQMVQIPRTVLDQYCQILLSQPSINSDKLDDARERIIKLESEVGHLKDEIKEIKENKKFNLSLLVSIASAVICLVSCWLSYTTYQKSESLPLSTMQQSVVPDTQR